jgi:6-phosphogluconate dehydrogenase
MSKDTIGLIGCGVMGQNLALNFERHGFPVAVYDTDQAKVANYLQERAARKRIVAAPSLAALVENLERPRRILMLVPAGPAVDQCLEQLLSHLDQGDILVDGGNSHFADTERRTKRVESAGFLFVGAGISGGEEGALRGPSIMPGGSRAAWPRLQPLFERIVAQAPDGTPCCDWIGPGGAGHFVKMVHNGIEYGELQLIGEACHFMQVGLGLSATEVSAVFDEWNHGELASFLIGVTRDVLAYRDANGGALVEKILDAAGQKGTGKWVAQTALDLGQPLTLMAEAVFARCLSALKDERLTAAAVLPGPCGPIDADRAAFLDDLWRALYASKIVACTQGFQLLRAAGREFGWNLDFGRIAGLWRAGCIIRAALLERIRAAFAADADLVSLLLAPCFSQVLRDTQSGWRRTVATAARIGVPVPALSAALAYYDGYRCARLPANLLQAQRDYFGAHRYERTDRPRGMFFHTDWQGSATGGPDSARPREGES